MNGIMRKSVSLVALLAMLLALFAPAAVAADAPVKITILETSDLHGNIFPTDYYTGKSASVGLASVATVVNQVRAENPNTLLLDCGDTIQGTPLVSYYNKQNVTNPMTDVMNYMKYDAATLGNHEFNFGFTVLKNFTDPAKFPIIAANVLKADNTPAYTPYIVKNVQGVKIGILGLTNQAIPTWEQPENYAGLHFQSQVEAAKKWVPVLRDTEKVDVVVVLAHSGPEANLAQDIPNKGPAGQVVTGTPGESEVVALSQVPGIDVILNGHLHGDYALTLPNGVVVVEPKNNGAKVGRVDLTMDNSSGSWKITAKNAQTLAVDGAKADADVLNYAKAYNDTTLDYINTIIGKSTGEFSGATSQTADSAVMDLVNQVQLDISKADMSLAASFSTTSLIPTGDVRIKDVASVYIYENYLYVIEATGQQIKDALENSAKFFNQYDGVAPLVNPNVRGYNYDMLYGPGVTYKIDITKPVGQRIVGLTYKGAPIELGRTYKLAINNYRATGGGYDTFKTCNILSKASIEIREQIIEYFKSHPNVTPVNDQHWTILPNYLSDPAKASIDTLVKQGLVTYDEVNAVKLGSAISHKDLDNLLIKTFGVASTDPSTLKDENPIHRQDAIQEAAYLAGLKPTNPAAALTYTDASSINPYLTRAIYASSQAGLIPATGELRPLADLTWSEAYDLVAKARFRPISILSTNDVHGYLSSEPGYFGRAITAGYLNLYRAKNPNGTLVLDAGDSMQGTMISNVFFGKSIIEAMNAMGYDAAAIGNHEFDWNATRLAERVDQANYPVLSANIFDKKTGNRPEWAKPYAMVNKNGLKIGVIGFTTTETPTIVLAANIKDYDVKDPVPYVNEYAKELRAQGADIIVVLAHEGGSAINNGVVSGAIADLAAKFVGVDAIVGGHTHNNHAGTAAGIAYVSNKDKGRGIGDIELRYDTVTGKVVSAVASTIVPTETGATPDAAVKAIVDSYDTQIAPLRDEVIGKTDVDLVRDYNGESNIGNWMADIMRGAAKTDFAFTNAGGIRVDLPKGDLTLGSIYQVMPFDNTLYTMNLTGAQIKELLEQGAKLEKGMLQLSGLKFQYDSTKPAGSRVVKMTKLDGTPISLTKTYTVVTNDFMSTGGDNFTTFAKGTNRVNTYRLIRDEMVNWVKAQTAAGRVVHPVIDGRVTKIK